MDKIDIDASQYEAKQKAETDFADIYSSYPWLFCKYCIYKLWAQMQVVAPIATYMMVFQITALQSPVIDAGVVILGLLAVVVGLAIFLEGLEIGLMPIGEKVGTVLPKKQPMWLTFIICFILGIGVTFAEPSIEALQTLGVLLEPEIQPYLYFLLHEPYDIVLVLFIGLGVGVGCVLGVHRMTYGGTLKRQIYTATPLCLAISAYMTWGNDDLKGAMDFCWDCGAITTGPVTVPIVLALGIGLASNNQENPSKLAGFGVVTLASLYPIISVQILVISLTFIIDKETILAGVVDDEDQQTLSWIDESPWREVFSALQSVGPLVIFLVIILKLILREKLPEGHLRERIAAYFEEELIEMGKSSDMGAQMNGQSVGGDRTPKSISRARFRRSSSLRSLAKALKHSASIRSITQAVKKGSMSGSPHYRHLSISHRGSGASHKVSGGSIEYHYGRIEDEEAADVEEENRAQDKAVRELSSVSGHSRQPYSESDNEMSSRRRGSSTMTIVGMFMVYIGMLTFSIGLQFGLGALGQQTGTLIPALFAKIDEVSVSPYYNETAGLAIAIAFIFVLGLGATIAEPALSVLGTTVEHLTNRKFKKFLLIGVVALGVGIGIALAIVKVVFQFPLIYVLLPAYIVALSLTVISDDDFVGVAWDSAGVTTGPITVPLILTLGVAFGGVLETTGFGILALASVGPIISVLTCGIIVTRNKKRKPVAVGGERPLVINSNVFPSSETDSAKARHVV